MAEENQVMKEPQQVMKEPQRVTTKDPKKVEVGKRLAAINRKKREAKKREEKAKLEKTISGVNQYYRIGTIPALGVIGGAGYYIYQSKEGEVQNNPPKQPPGRAVWPPRPQVIATQPQTNKFEMD